MKGNFEICDYPNLEKIVVKKKSLKNLYSLKIHNNENLQTIEIEDGILDTSFENNTFNNVKIVIIESIIVGYSIIIIYLPNLQSINIGCYSFENAECLRLSSIHHRMILNQLKDLPYLSTLIIGGFNKVKEFDICDHSHLENLLIHKNTLQTLSSLMIRNNPVLKSIEFEDCDEWEVNGNYQNNCALFSVNNLIIESI